MAKVADVPLARIDITIPGLEALTRAREAAETGASKRRKR
jgi:hypothetical protein